MIIPSIGARGFFTFKSPYDIFLHNEQRYTVSAIRSILEMEESGEKPYKTIYEVVGLDNSVFTKDLNTNVPIVVLKTDANEYAYVPASYIITEPSGVGIDYRKYALYIELGHLPVNYNFTTVKSVVKDTVYDTIGVTTEPKVVPTGATIAISEVEDIKYTKLLTSKKTINKSYKTKYNEAMMRINELETLITKYESYVVGT